MIIGLIAFIAVIILSGALVTYKRHQRIKAEWRAAFTKALHEVSTDANAPPDWAEYYATINEGKNK